MNKSLNSDSKPNKLPKKDINYPKTFRHLTYSFVVAQSLSTVLNASKKAFSSLDSRAYMVVHLFRVAWYQIMVLSCQYLNGLITFSLLSLEVVVLLWLIKTQSRIRHLKSIIFVASVFQSLALSLFLVLSFLLHFKGFNEWVDPRPQKFGIMILLVAIIIEWILTILGLVAYSIFPLIKRKSKAQSAALERASQIIFYHGNETCTKDKPLPQAESKNTNTVEGTSHVTTPGSNQPINLKKIKRRIHKKKPTPVLEQPTDRVIYASVYKTTGQVNVQESNEKVIEQFPVFLGNKKLLK